MTIQRYDIVIGEDRGGNPEIQSIRCPDGLYANANEAADLEAKVVSLQEENKRLREALVSVFNDIDVYFGHAHACNRENAELLLWRLSETSDRALKVSEQWEGEG